MGGGGRPCGGRARRSSRPARISGCRLPSGFTPLLFAVREGRIDVVRVLLKAGADVNETMQVERRPRRGYGGRPPPAGASALLLAVMNGHFELAAHLLDAGADPNADLPGLHGPARDHGGPQARHRRQRSGARGVRQDEQPRAREEARRRMART